MARMPRSDSFLVDAPRLVEDERVVGLSLLAAGAYFRIFFRGWTNPERPGFLVANDAYLCGLAQCPFADWPSIRVEIEPIFDAISEPGFWIVPGLPATYLRQNLFVEAQRAKGVKSGKARRKNRGSISVGDSVEPNPQPSLGSRFSVLGEPQPPSSTKTPVEESPPRATPAAPRGGFVRPTLLQVEAYCVERAVAGHRAVDPQAWFDHYESNGWRVGKAAMKNWQAAVRTWERSQHGNQSTGKSGKMTARQILDFAQTQQEES